MTVKLLDHILSLEIYSFKGLYQHKNDGMVNNYSNRIAGYFRTVFIFGYFEQAFFYENKFPGPTVIRKHIVMIK